MEIRIAGEATSLAELNSLLYREDAGTYDPFADIEAACMDAMNYFTGFLEDDSTTAFLAVENGTVAGYLAARFQARTLRQKVSTATLESIYVRREFRNRQVGTLLVDSFLRWAAERCAERAAVTAFFANESARRFYARFGFAPKVVTLDMAL
jgi:GNAT superfamily N-acetyltransferase